jgi:hypothetical protein
MRTNSDRRQTRRNLNETKLQKKLHVMPERPLRRYRPPQDCRVRLLPPRQRIITQRQSSMVRRVPATSRSEL